MKILVTGSAGHLGEALMRSLSNKHYNLLGMDIKSSAYTNEVLSIADRESVAKCMQGVEVVLHAATLHKPHVATHSRQEFVDVNITGTLNLLEEAVKAKVKAFVFTSTTSVFGRALRPSLDKQAVWVDETLNPIPRNIYGVTKLSAENLCEFFHYKFNLPCIVLRTSRFFLEEDDDPEIRGLYVDDNIKVNEYLYRRVDIEDIVAAHLLAINKASEIGFDRYIISATTPFTREDQQLLRTNAPQVVERILPEYTNIYATKGWKMFQNIDRIYDNSKALKKLGWKPRYDFLYVMEQLKNNREFRSPLALLIGKKGYHKQKFTDGPFPIEDDRLSH